jgi:predicted amino acid dehydrogenase
MDSRASEVQIEEVIQAIQRMKLDPHPMPGPTRTAIGITGNTGAVDARSLEVLPGVKELIRRASSADGTQANRASRAMSGRDAARRQLTS